MNNFKEKVFGMWLGKAIGGTLGMPWEGCSNPLNLKFYTPMKSFLLGFCFVLE